MEDRYLKIHQAPGAKRDVPRILLQGQWLSNYGYNVGDRIKVSFQDSRIIVELDPIVDAKPHS